MSEPPIETRGAQMLALRKARMAASPPILRGGFRPFFLLGSAWAVMALVIWLCVLFAGRTLPSAFDALAWHRHEMMFGFIGAMIAGFLLTAIPNWTGRLPIAGAPLAALVGVWFAARVVVLVSGVFGLLSAALIDVGFYLLMAFVAAREIVASRNRNLPLVALVLLFGAADALDYAGAFGMLDPELGFRSGVALVVVFISIIGGRIIPSFTRNWLAKRGHARNLPGQPTRYDLGVVALTALALLAWMVAPETRAAGVLLPVAALLQLARLARWSGHLAARDPLLVILHVGYLWLPVGLALLGWSVLDPVVPRTAAIHALTAGAMATMILAVTTRATLGHTGHELRANLWTTFAYGLVTLGAIVRVIAALGWTPYDIGILAAGALWGAAFATFVFAYAPILFRPRLGAPD